MRTAVSSESATCSRGRRPATRAGDGRSRQPTSRPKKSHLSKDYWPERVGGRHFSVANVLHVDGHASTRAPDEIDPRIRDFHEAFWRPRHDHRSRY
jgi:prepilin-type processing-associated H-X9-DG protein